MGGSKGAKRSGGRGRRRGSTSADPDAAKSGHSRGSPDQSRTQAPQPTPAPHSHSADDVRTSSNRSSNRSRSRPRSRKSRSHRSRSRRSHRPSQRPSQGHSQSPDHDKDKDKEEEDGDRKTRGTFQPRRIRDEDKRDELTAYDDTQWSEKTKGDDARGLGKVPSPVRSQKEGNEEGGMAMQQTMEEPGKDGQLAGLGNAEAGGAVPGELMAGAAVERDAYLDHRPRISLGLRMGVVLAVIVSWGLLFGRPPPWKEGTSGLYAVLVFPLPTLVVNVVVGLGFLLRFHVGTDPDNGVRKWKPNWMLFPVMGDALALLSAIAAATLAIYYSTRVEDVNIVPYWLVSAIFLAIAAALNIPTAIFIIKGRLL